MENQIQQSIDKLNAIRSQIAELIAKHKQSKNPKYIEHKLQLVRVEASLLEKSIERSNRLARFNH